MFIRLELILSLSESFESGKELELLLSEIELDNLSDVLRALLTDCKYLVVNVLFGIINVPFVIIKRLLFVFDLLDLTFFLWKSKI